MLYQGINHGPDIGGFPGRTVPDGDLQRAVAELGCLPQHLIKIGEEIVEIFGGRIPHGVFDAGGISIDKMCRGGIIEIALAAIDLRSRYL